MSRGETTLIWGPMYSGKSTVLFKRLKKYATRGEVVVITYDNDTRYSRNDLACSHDGEQMRALRVSSLGMQTSR